MQIKERNDIFACQISNNEKGIILNAAGTGGNGFSHTRPWVIILETTHRAKYDRLRFLKGFIPFGPIIPLLRFHPKER